MAKLFKNPYKGKNDTPKGTLTAEQATRHGLTQVEFGGSAAEPGCRKRYWRNRKAKKIFELVRTYRQIAHGVNQPRLANSLRLAIHFLIEPMDMSRSGGGNWGGKQDNDNSLAAVAVPLKV